MYRYNRYIARHLVHSTLLITFSLTSIVWLTQALRFIDFIVNQGVSILVFLKLTTLLIPSLLFMILPPALLCAVLFTYYKLKTDSELVVLQAAGLSRWRLSIPALQAAGGISLICYVIAFYVLPVSAREFKEMQYYLRNNYASILLQEGVFNNPVEGLTVFIRDRDHNDILHGILVHDTRQADSSITMMAEEGKMTQTAQGPRFLLKNGNRQEMQHGRLSLLNFQDYAMDISLYTESSQIRVPDTQEMPLGQLFADDPTLTPMENNKRHAEGHQRILWPAYPVVLTLIALCAMLLGDFNRRGHWKRVAFGAVLATLLLFTSIGLRGAMANNPWLIPIAYLNLLAPIGVAGWMLSYYGWNPLPRQRLAQ